MSDERLAEVSLGFDPAMLDASEAGHPATLNRARAEVVRRIASAVDDLSMPDLVRLLQFVPPVELKHRADAAAAVALAIDVTGVAGVEAADRALAPIRAAIAEIERGFEDPTSLAFQLHRRMTGLRTEFKKLADEALATVGKRIYDEDKRIKDAVAATQLAAQADANAQAREDAARHAEAAAAAGAPAEVVTTMFTAAAAATAPPVPALARVPQRTTTSSVKKYKARLRSTLPNAEPNPAMNELTASQQAEVRAWMRATANGEPGTKLTYFEISWSDVNADAAKQGTTFACPTLETFDAGGTRAKPGRRG